MLRHPIHIPKTGTWSVKAGMERGGIPLIVNGHMRAQDMREKIGKAVELGATIRRPDDRLVSMMNHLWGNNPLVSLDEALEQVIADQATAQVFRTSTWHIDPETRLFPFDGLPLLRWLGWDGPLPHDNQSKKRFFLRDVELHPLWKDALAIYWEDWQLYEMAKQSPGCCAWETSGA